MFKFKKRKSWTIKRRWAIIAGTLTVVLSLGAAFFSQVGFNINADLPTQTVITDDKLKVTGTANRVGNTTTWRLSLTRFNASKAQTGQVSFSPATAGLEKSIALVNGRETELENNKVTVDFAKDVEQVTVTLTAETAAKTDATLNLPISFGLFDKGDMTKNLIAIANQRGTLAFTPTSDDIDKKAVKMVPDADSDGIIPATAPDPSIAYQAMTAVDVNAKAADPSKPVNLIEANVQTDPNPTTGLTDPNNFQIWGNNYSVVAPDKDGNVSTALEGVQITPKFNVSDTNATGTTDSNIGGDRRSTRPADIELVRTNYHYQYYQGSGAANRSSFVITFADDDSLSASDFTVLYNKVGSYVDADSGDTYTVGAILKLHPNAGTKNQQLGDLRYIDVPNVLSSGIQYHGMDSLDIEVQFYQSVNGQFVAPLNVENGQLTFSSLNNFGYENETTWDDNVMWEENTGIKNGIFAESVDVLDRLDGDVQNVDGILSDPTTMVDSKPAGQTTAQPKRYFSSAHGSATLLTDDQYNDLTPDDITWSDILGSRSFQRGSLGYAIDGTAYAFRLYSGTDNTWQTFSAGVNSPIALTQADKAVSSSGLTLAQVASQIPNTTNGGFGDYDKQDFADVINSADTSYDATQSRTVYNFSYYIRQKTYALGTDSIAIPYELVLSDSLPEGVSLRNSLSSDTNYDYTQDIVITCADGTTLDPKYYAVLIEPNPDKPAEQLVKVQFDSTGIRALDWDGDYFMIELQVKVPVDVPQVTKVPSVTFDNVATMITSMSEVDTNHVTNTEKQALPDLTLTKQDSATFNPVDLTTATFTATFNGTEIPAGDLIVADSHVTLKNLQVGQTRLTETKAPIGYQNPIDVLINCAWDTETLSYVVDANVESGDSFTMENEQWASGAMTGTFTNDAYPVRLDLAKTDDLGDALAGATFTLKNMTDDSAAVNLVADSSGVLFTQAETSPDYDLAFDKVYKLTETSAPAGYAKAPSQYFKVQANYGTNPAFAVIFVRTDAAGNALSGGSAIPVTTESDADGKQNYTGHFTFEDSPKAVFPLTGGVGMASLYGTAIALAVIAGTTYFVRRRLAK
jgi:hypothetical protein